MSAIRSLSEQQFEDEVIQSSIPVLLDFTATWCGPCKSLLPALEDVALAYQGQFKVLSIDVDAESELSKRFRIKGVPTLIVFNQGNEQERLSGIQTRGKLTSIMEQYLGEG